MENQQYKRLIALIEDGEAMKSDSRSDSFWCDELDSVLETLMSIRDMFSMNSGVAEESFREQEIFSYSSFKDYTATKYLSASRIYNKSGMKARNIRASTKKLSCPLCHGRNIKTDGQNLVCMNPDCKNIIPISSIETGHSIVSKTKHVSDKLSILTGIKNPPISVLNIREHLAVWLRKLSFIKDFLYSKGKAYANRFLSEYATVLYENGRNSAIDREKIKRKIGSMYAYSSTGRITLNLDYGELPNEPEFAYSFKEYKLMVTEFCAMLNECSRLYEAKYINSTILTNDDDKIVELFTAFIDEHHRAPVEKETFKFGKESFDIGNFITYLKLTYGDPDTERLVALLDPLFIAGVPSLDRSPLRIAGLMFPFIHVAQSKGGKESIVPKRYTFTENYGFLIHEIFRIPHITIDPHDKEYIIDIIVRFDDFSSKTLVGGRNSKIYSAKLQLIFNMPYFVKYRELIHYLPLKAGDTSDLISKVWGQFCVQENDFISRFHQPREETNDNKDDYLSQLISSIE